MPNGFESERQLSANEVRRAQLSLLEDVAALCRSHDILWFAAYGTLLGSIRHSGFIPWDDDVDVWIPRRDLHKFTLALQRSHLAGHLLLSGENMQNWHLDCLKLSVPNTRAQLSDGRRMPYGINIDIFPLDGYPPRISLVLDNILRVVLRCLYETRLKRLRRLVRALRLTQRLSRLRHRLASRHPAEGCAFATCLTVFNSRFKIDARAFFPPTSGKFEHLSLSIPSDSRAVLSCLYGDYLAIPDAQDRHFHDERFFVPA